VLSRSSAYPAVKRSYRWCLPVIRSSTVSVVGSTLRTPFRRSRWAEVVDSQEVSSAQQTPVDIVPRPIAAPEFVLVVLNPVHRRRRPTGLLRSRR
jgi:hypothetical protein